MRLPAWTSRTPPTRRCHRDRDAAPVFDPVAAEHDAVAAGDDVVFRFDADALDNADDVLSLHAMETLSLDDDAGLHPSLEIVDAAALRCGRARLPADHPADVPVEAPAAR
jgi:chemosensory pili system protein ChpA (sensor histidine kinase/response regulator)